MEGTININGKDVKFTLTEAQEALIKKHSAKVIDRIKTFEDACEDLGIDPDDVLPFANPINARQEAANAFAMLDVISESLLEGAILDWTNDSQKKWYPWFNNYQPGSGFRFDATYYVWADTAAYGGARLCLDTQEKANYFGKQFLDIWNKFLNPNKQSCIKKLQL